jgi:hypothetical protein
MGGALAALISAASPRRRHAVPMNTTSKPPMHPTAMLRRGPAQRDELEQVRDASHRRHQEVGERAEEAEHRSEWAGGSRERGQQRDRGHCERRQERPVAGRERDHGQDEARTGRDHCHAPRDPGRPTGPRRGHDQAGQGSQERPLLSGKGPLRAAPTTRPHVM